MDYTVYYDLLRRTSLFRGMDDADLDDESFDPIGELGLGNITNDDNF